MVSLIIPVYNGLAYTKKCVEDLRSTLQGIEHEVIIVDDISTDGTRQYLKTLQEPFRVILNDKRGGVAIPCNKGAEAARGQTLCFLNNDMEFSPGWLQPMLQGLENLPKAGIIGNVHWSPRTGRYDHMGMVINPKGLPTHMGRYWRFIPFSRPREWFTIPSACWVIKRDVYLDAGGQDSSYITGCEDMDLCLRLYQKGFRHYVVYNSVVKHYVSVSPSRHDHTKENEKLFLARWGHFLQQHRSKTHIRLHGLNYLGRFLDRPWRYNGIQFLRAWRELILGI